LGDIVQFVDSIASSPTVRLDLNNENPWALRYDGTDLSPPLLQSAWSDTLLADGALQVASAYGNRTLRLRLELITSTVDAQATALQNLQREMDRATNFLRWQPTGATNPVFFRTMRSAGNRITEYPGAGTLRVVDVEIQAEPFGYGLKQTLAPVTVYNDPAEGTTLNANPFFETDVSSWTAVGGTLVRSTAHNISAPASGLLTPDGVTATVQVRSEAIATPVGRSVRASAWVWSTVARNVDLVIRWTDGADALLSTSTLTTALSAGAWTFLDLIATAPASTVFSHLVASMSGTPPVGNTIWIDNARLRFPGSVGAMSFDVTGVIGDVETPLYLSVSNASPGIEGRTTCIATRRRGNPDNVPFVVQAESMTVSTDTSFPGNDPLMSGTGNNYARITFATTTTLADRLDLAAWPNTTSADLRGTYRCFVRCRHSVAGDLIQVQMLVNYNGYQYFGPLVACQQVTQIRWVDLGLVSYPGGTDPVTDGPTGIEIPVLGNASLQFRAARVSGTGNLDVDAFVFVPADDRLSLVAWSFFSGPTAFVVDSGRELVYALTSGVVSGEGASSIAGGLPFVTPQIQQRIFFVPHVGESQSSYGSDDKTATTVVTPYYWPRYLILRPVGT
jgi:hypothetical protein